MQVAVWRDDQVPVAGQPFRHRRQQQRLFAALVTGEHFGAKQAAAVLRHP